MEPQQPQAFSWFPGHMRAAWRRLQADLKLCDLALFVLDARAPVSSRHPELEQDLSRRDQPALLILNKADLAEAEQTRRWIAYLESQGHAVVSMNSTSGQGCGDLRPHLDKLGARVTQRRALRRVASRDLRLLVAGLPNVGKSSLLNRLVGRNAARTGKKPGLTRGRAQWVAGPFGWKVLDSPGITCPRIETGWQLAALCAVGCIRADVVPLDQVSETLLEPLTQQGLVAVSQGDCLLEGLALDKKFLMKGARPDTQRAARWLLSACMEGRFGRLTWELCPV